jgi:hypothetical protein
MKLTNGYWNAIILLKSKDRYKDTATILKYLKKNNIPFDFDRNAKFLSSYVYLWPVSTEFAEKELRKIWDTL